MLEATLTAAAIPGVMLSLGAVEVTVGTVLIAAMIPRDMLGQGAVTVTMKAEPSTAVML